MLSGSVKGLFKWQGNNRAGDAFGSPYNKDGGSFIMRGHSKVNTQEHSMHPPPSCVNYGTIRLYPVTVARNSICSMPRLQCAIDSFLWEYSLPLSKSFGCLMQSSFEILASSTTEEGQSNEKLGKECESTFLQENIENLFSKHMNDVQAHQTKGIQVKSTL